MNNAVRLLAPVGALIAATASAQYKYADVHDFAGVDGLLPVNIAIDAKGNLFGTTAFGGPDNFGTAWEVTSAGAYKVIYNFGASATDGTNPWGGIAVDAGGNLWGTTAYGGSHNVGTLWEFTVAGVYKQIHSFGSTSSDGTVPQGAIAFDKKGNLFGTTYNNGTIWELTAGGTYKILRTFSNGQTDGDDSISGVALDSSGDVFGANAYGGPHGDGVAWEYTAGGVFKVLHAFGATTSDGWEPCAVAVDTKGNLFGVTQEGGGQNYAGVVWEVTAAGAYSIIHPFNFPYANYASTGLTIDPSGDLVGGALGNGSAMVWKLSTTGTFQLLESYPDSKNLPWFSSIGHTQGVAFDSKGDIFGTSAVSGTFGLGYGTVWEISAAGGYRVFHNFGFPEGDAHAPESSVTTDAAGDMFGTTHDGGSYGWGTVWEFPKSGSYKILHAFSGTNGDGAFPGPGATLDAKGDLFGTTYQGGTHNIGTIWEITAAGAYKVVYTFGTGSSDGLNPVGCVSVDAAGDLFGATAYGGPLNAGTVWEIPAGKTTGKLVYGFGSISNDAYYPASGVTLDAKGDIFGTTQTGGLYGRGAVWEIPSGKAYKLLYSFGTTSQDGINPVAGVTLDSKGDIFGTCSTVQNGSGTVWEITASGTYKTLHNFGYTTAGDGGAPTAPVVIDASGNLYGTAGAAINTQSIYGVVWEIPANGSYKILYTCGLRQSQTSNPNLQGVSFLGVNSFPTNVGGVTLGPQGKLLLTTTFGGAFNYGGIWELVPASP